jgi:2-polyprenyl-3-methyl-5-hydroxy-6-metoxy-1,4-benzoquinol methylase
MASLRLSIRTGLKSLRLGRLAGRPCVVKAAPLRWHSGAATTVDSSELRKFAEMSAQWWRHDGPFAGLHQMNSVRVPLIRRAARAMEPRGADQTGSLTGLSIVDIGCGGGILSEALARLGARVTGVDAAPENVVAAEHHRRLDPRLGEQLSYVNTTAEQLVEEGHRFDIVVASEVLEHVSDVPAFLTAASSLMKVRTRVSAIPQHRCADTRRTVARHHARFFAVPCLPRAFCHCSQKAPS